ncbi:MAG: 4-hydroxy-tetrahydrodipicolinate synthase [Gammaproteobacteria bacterium 28-57-27]|nr:MAG: 4-hydroxy-tetrahydrodipicolinate synthase [Gammaproteobacteria bacterium 28-57-27]
MFHGSMVALVTPMRADGALDFAALKRLVEWHIAEGTDVIVSVGTTGESATLDVNEHLAMVERTLEYVAGRIPVIAGTGANSTREAIELSTQAVSLGVDGCLLVTPYYNKPTQEGLYRHYLAIADAVPAPLVLYNVPGRTACDMQPSTVERLADVANIVGIKEASGSLARAQELVDRLGARVAVFAGDDALAREVMLQGGRGVISVTANVAPRAMADMAKAALAGDAARAAALDAPLAELHQKLFVESNPIPVKFVLHAMGMIEAGIRLPLTWLSAEHHATLRDAMASAHIQSVVSA